MALIEVFHVVASQFEIDATATPDIPQGSLVGLNTVTGEVQLSVNTAATRAVGVAGDSRSAGTTSYTPESGSALSRTAGDGTGALVTGAWGAGDRYTQNRVADNYNEVLASGKMTVYHSGGEFWTDMYCTTASTGADLTAALVPGALLYASTAYADADEGPDFGGRFTTQDLNTFAWVCGQVLQGPLDYPSGVPGTTTGFTQLPEGGNSLSWGHFVRVKLLI